MLESSGFYEYGRESRPAIIVLDNGPDRIFDVYHHATNEDLLHICEDHALDYLDLEEIYNNVKPGTHTLMIDLPTYRAAQTNES